MKKVLTFRGTARVVIEAVTEDLKASKMVRAVEVKYFGLPNSGSLTLTADSQPELNVALSYLSNHRVYKHHFEV